MRTGDKERRSVKTTETVFAILECLQEHDGAGITEVATELDLAKSTVHRHLATLVDNEYVVKEGSVYRIGLRFIDLGQHARNRHQAFEMAKPIVKELANETEERAQFIVEEHGWAVYVHRKRGSHAVRTDPGIGKRIPINQTAAGKSILAHFPESKVREIIDKRGLPSGTTNSITEESNLFDELEQIRERGYALNNQEIIKGLRAVGVPVFGPSGEVIGGLSVAGPNRRFDEDRVHGDLPDLMLGLANEFELNLAYS